MPDVISFQEAIEATDGEDRALLIGNGFSIEYFSYANLLAEAKSAAEKIAQKSQIAAIAAKDAVDRAYETTLAEGLNYERRLFQSLFATEDQTEGMAAFLEKREAQFRDR